MELQRQGGVLEIRLGPWERLPLAQIQAVGTTLPSSDPWMIRAPGNPCRRHLLQSAGAGVLV